jgi:hypothetical protein
VFTARYALSPYIKQIRFVFKGLSILVKPCIFQFRNLSLTHNLVSQNMLPWKQLSGSNWSYCFLLWNKWLARPRNAHGSLRNVGRVDRWRKLIRVVGMFTCRLLVTHQERRCRWKHAGVHQGICTVTYLEKPSEYPMWRSQIRISCVCHVSALHNLTALGEVFQFSFELTFKA